MKKYALIALLALSAFSCTSSTENASENTEMTEESVAYACPMHCEGDKTYSEPGECPVCGMDLEEQVAEMESHEDIHPEH